MNLFRCWSVWCHVWYFGGNLEENKDASICPACGGSGVPVSITEQASVHQIWDS